MLMGLTSKTMYLLETLMENVNDMELQEIAVKTRLPKSTVHRILASLEKGSWILQDSETRKYSPGPRMLIFADYWRLNQSLVKIAHQPMKELVQRTGETTVLFVLDGYEARCIHIVESPQAIKFYFRVGGSFPLHAGAAGQVILAFSPPELLEQFILQPLQAFSENTITSPQILKEKIEGIRRLGYGVSIEEVHTNGRAIGAPILFDNHRFMANLLISGFKGDRNKIEDIAPLVVKTANYISSMLTAGDEC